MIMETTLTVHTGKMPVAPTRRPLLHCFQVGNVTRWLFGSLGGGFGGLFDEFLDAFAENVAGVKVPLGIFGDAVQPVQIAGTFLAVGGFGDGPQLEKATGGVELHENLVFRWAAQGERVLVRFPPRHRRGTANPNLILGRHVEPPRNNDVAPNV